VRDVRDEIATHRLQATQVREVLYDQKELAVGEAPRHDPLKPRRVGPLDLGDAVRIGARSGDRIDRLVVADDIHQTPTRDCSEELVRRAVRALDLAVGVRDEDRVAKLVDQDRQAIPFGLGVMSLPRDAIGHRAERIAEAPRLVRSSGLEARGAAAGDRFRAPRQRADRTGDRARQEDDDREGDDRGKSPGERDRPAETRSERLERRHRQRDAGDSDDLARVAHRDRDVEQVALYRRGDPDRAPFVAGERRGDLGPRGVVAHRRAIFIGLPEHDSGRVDERDAYARARRDAVGERIEHARIARAQAVARQIAREARLAAEPGLEGLGVVTVGKARCGEREDDDPREKSGQSRKRRAARDGAD